MPDAISEKEITTREGLEKINEMKTQLDKLLEKVYAKIADRMCGE